MWFKSKVMDEPREKYIDQMFGKFKISSFSTYLVHMYSWNTGAPAPSSLSQLSIHPKTITLFLTHYVDRTVSGLGEGLFVVETL